MSDQVIWSGALLGAECERWAATRDPAALARVKSLLHGLETLAAVTGERGLLARFACPAGWIRSEPRPEEWRAGGPGWEEWRWRGDLSKDQLSGLVYGLASVGDLVEDPGARARAALLLGAVADRLLGRGGVYEDAGGVPSTYGDVRPRFLGLPVGVNAAVTLGLADAAARATGEPRHRRWLEALVAGGACGSLPFATVRILGRENFNNPNMTALALASILRTPPPPGDEVRARLREGARTAMARILALHRGEGNAFWIAVALPAGPETGVTGRDLRDARAQLLRFPAVLAQRRTDLSGRTDLARCAWNSRRGRSQFLLPLPVDALGPGSFAWKSNPFEVLQDPDEEGNVFYSGTDFLAAYWPLRRLGVVE